MADPAVAMAGPAVDLSDPAVANPHAKATTRDTRIKVQTLRDIGWKYQAIATELDLTLRQVQYAVNHPLTPAKRSGRPSGITHDELEAIIEWVIHSKNGRRCQWSNIPIAMGLPYIGWYAIRNALRNAGFKRYVARRKPPISEVNRVKRLAFAIEHLNWSIEDWSRILWSDETWVTGGRHTKTWVTRRPGEEWDPTCIVERHQRKNGWMFWGCFNNTMKRPCVF